MLDWNDLRIFLAVVRGGSALAAARELNLNQTTVSRRIEVLEHALGATLFVRTSRGSIPSADASQLLPYAEAVETAVQKLEGEAGRKRRTLSGEIRVTAPEVLMAQFVSPVTLRFREKHPEIRFDYISAEHRLDLSKGEADVAFRASGGVDNDTLFRVPLPDVAWSVYGSQAYRNIHGLPQTPGELGAHRIVTYTGPIARLPVSDYMMTHIAPGNIVATSNSVPNMAGTLRAGHGVGLLPCVLGDQFDGLLRCFDPPEGLISRWWIVTSAEAHQLPRVRSFMAFAAEAIRAERALLSGKGPGA
jgi:DNA-binding transcriptional LysR family regulator